VLLLARVEPNRFGFLRSQTQTCATMTLKSAGL
jgi:hypothetical protein